MVHPYLFLQFFRNLLEPLHISAAGADAIAYTWLIIASLLILSMVATKGLKAVPGGLQNFMEVIVSGIENMVVETMGHHGKPFFPLIATLAIFILSPTLSVWFPVSFRRQQTSIHRGMCSDRLRHHPCCRYQRAWFQVYQAFHGTYPLAGTHDVFH